MDLAKKTRFGGFSAFANLSDFALAPRAKQRSKSGHPAEKTPVERCGAAGKIPS
jgi:hypothetical protein